MTELFGVPMSGIAMTLAVLFGVAVLVLLYILLRNTVLFRMAARNVPRRPAQSILIVLGMMLATAIISSAFTTGDSISSSIEGSVTQDLQLLDQIIAIDDEADVWEGGPVPESFPESVLAEIGPAFRGDPDVDGVLPVWVQNVAAAHAEQGQFDVTALLVGVDPTGLEGFGPLRDAATGEPIDLASLETGQVVVDQRGAEELQLQEGDTVTVPIGQAGPAGLRELAIAAVSDGWYFRREETNVVFTAPLGHVQQMLGQEGRINRILISNRGGVDSGEPLTPAIQERLGDLPALREAGLELVPIKSDLIDLANQIASLFVTIFTTFGLFSIGVGILLIFLIFSMLAAERKSEMGTARAIGMQRRHLIQMFIAEGSLYSLAAAVVGALAGVGVGYLLVIGVASAFAQGAPSDEFTLSPAVTPRSVLVSFFIGSVVTFATVAIAAWRTSRLNIVRAIRDVPEPQRTRAGRRTLIFGILLVLVGLVLMLSGFQQDQFTPFGLGVSLLPMGVALILRWRGVAERWAFTFAGLVLMVFWLLPGSVTDRINDEWQVDFSAFFVTGALVVTGAVLVVMNNADLALGLLTRLLGGQRALAPVVKSAVAYPLRAGFRTGLSVAMFAVILFSIVVMSIVTTGFNKVFEDQDRVAGGYEAIAFAQTDLNPVQDLRQAVERHPDLGFIPRVDGEPAVGTVRTIGNAGARLAGAQGEVKDSRISGVDDDFVATNRYSISLATAEFALGGGFDGRAVWQALRDNPGLAVISAQLIPTRAGFNFDVAADRFRANVPGLFLENDTMEPFQVLVRDRRSGAEFEVTVIGVVDDFGFFLPTGLFTSTPTLQNALPRPVDANRYFFKVEPGASNAAARIEAAFFQNGMDTIDIQETLAEASSANSSVNNLLIGFMALGLVVGIAAVGVISARAVVERRHHIGVMRAIGFSRRMVGLTFLAESSFIALMGIALGILLGIITSINIANAIQQDEPSFQLVIPWLRVALMGVGAYAFSLLTTFLPARQASTVAPADALRYE